jgi:hypothetical protein
MTANKNPLPIFVSTSGGLLNLYITVHPLDIRVLHTLNTFTDGFLLMRNISYKPLS